MLHFVSEHFGDLMVATSTLVLAWTTFHLWTRQERESVATRIVPWKHIHQHNEDTGETSSSDTTWDSDDVPPTR